MAVDRRTVIAAAAILGLGVSAWVQAQPGRIPRIGFLSLISLKSDSRIPGFVGGLKDLGYVEGRTITIDWRSADGVADRLSQLAQDLVHERVDVIVAVQPQAVDAARRATKDIPIVFAAAQDPVGMGLVSSLSRPGGNITGASAMATDLMPKQLELLQQALPKMTHIAVLLNPTNPSGSRVMRKTVEEAASKANIAVVFIEARNTEELSTAFSRAKASKADAVVSGPDSFFIQARADMAKAGLAHGLPTMFMQREHVDAGGLMSYGPNMTENYRRAANFVDRILKGAKAGELPIEQPAKLDLVINLKTAQAVGLTIPSSLLVRADDVLR